MKQRSISSQPSPTEALASTFAPRRTMTFCPSCPWMSAWASISQPKPMEAVSCPVSPGCRPRIAAVAFTLSSMTTGPTTTHCVRYEAPMVTSPSEAMTTVRSSSA